jgi:hypothetical protein
MDKKTAGNRGMNTNTNNSGQGPVTVDKPQNGELFDRVAFILDQARANVVRSVNNQMVIAYWLIGLKVVMNGQSMGKKCLKSSLPGFPRGMARVFP